MVSASRILSFLLTPSANNTRGAGWTQVRSIIYDIVATQTRLISQRNSTRGLIKSHRLFESNATYFKENSSKCESHFYSNAKEYRTVSSFGWFRMEKLYIFFARIWKIAIFDLENNFSNQSIVLGSMRAPAKAMLQLVRKKRPTMLRNRFIQSENFFSP